MSADDFSRHAREPSVCKLAQVFFLHQLHFKQERVTSRVGLHKTEHAPNFLLAQNQT